MLNFKLAALFIGTFFLFSNINTAFASHVVINEVYYDVDSTHGQETDNEWIELFNTSISDVDLNGWAITDNSSTRTLASVIIKANGTLVIAAQSSTWNFWNITGDKIALSVSLGNGLSNSGDKLLLKDNNGVEHDKLSYGSNSDYSPFLPYVNEGHSLERIPAGSTFVDQSNPTPGVTSTSTSSPSSSPSPSPSPTTPSTSSTSSSSTSSFTISNVPSQIDSTETFSVSVNLSLPNSPTTTFYLKGAFKKADSSNYFGLIKVSGSWIKNNKTYSDQYKLTTDSSGSWTGNLEIQPDILDSGYEGSGDYIFKVGKYTESGSLTWSNEVTIKINAQEVVLEEAKDADILGAKSDTGKKSKISTSKTEELSLERYVKVATPSSKPPSATPSAEVKGERRINFLSIFGTIIVIIGAIPLGYAIYNKFRKRNQEIS